MCKRKKEEDLLHDFDIKLKGEKQKFASALFSTTYDLEIKREQSILEQSERLQIFHGLFAASFFLVTPSMDLPKATSMDKILLLLMTVLFLISLGLTFFVQWRFRHSSFPNIVQVKSDIERYPDAISSEDMKTEFLVHYYPDMIVSLEKNNLVRCNLLIAASSLSFVCVLSALVLLFYHAL